MIASAPVAADAGDVAVAVVGGLAAVVAALIGAGRLSGRASPEARELVTRLSGAARAVRHAVDSASGGSPDPRAVSDARYLTTEVRAHADGVRGLLRRGSEADVDTALEAMSVSLKSLAAGDVPAAHDHATAAEQAVAEAARKTGSRR